MAAIKHFGLAEHRAGSGALLSGELERIKGFLRSRGVLLAEGLGGCLVVAHTTVAAAAERALLDLGLRRVVLGASLDGLRGVADLTLAETRAFEVLSPGPLILAKGNGDDSQATLIAIPDSDDLRDIGSTLGGTATAFLQTGAGARAHVEGIVSDRADDRAFLQHGILEPRASIRNALELPTVVRISGPRAVECLAEGALAVDAITEASDVVSQWEIEDWT